MASLSLAGLFGISSILVNKQVQDNPVAKEADASGDDLFSTFYVQIIGDKWNTSGGIWNKTVISFYNHTNLANLYSDRTTGKVGSTQYLTQVTDTNYAIVDVPNGAKSFLITRENPNSSDDYVEPQLIYQQKTGLNRFSITSNYWDWQGYWQTGYWYNFDKMTPSNIYIDRAGMSGYSNTTKQFQIQLYHVIFAQSNYNYKDSSANYSFSGTYHYGGQDACNAISISNTKIAAIKIVDKDNTGTVIGDEFVYLPMISDRSVTYVYHMKTKTWDTNLPSQKALIFDITDTPSWYSSVATKYNSVKIRFKDFSDSTTGNYTTLYKIDFESIKYGYYTIPFGAKSFSLYSTGGSSSGDSRYTGWIEFSLAELFDGADYIFFKTTTNYTDGRNQEGEWDVVTFNINYPDFSGVHEDGYPTSYRYEDIQILDNPTKIGYDFDGYYLEDTYENRISSITNEDYGDFDLYDKWNQYTDIKISFDNGATTISLTPSAKVGSELYRLTSNTDIVIYDEEHIKLYKGTTDITSYATVSDGANNSIYSDNGTLKVHNYVYHPTYWVEVNSDGTFGIYASGYYNLHSGVFSDTTFYIQDNMNYTNNDQFGIVVYFFAGIGEANDSGEWAYSEGGTSKGYATKQGTSNTYKVTVPKKDGRQAKWSSFIVMRYNLDVHPSASDIAWDNEDYYWYSGKKARNGLRSFYNFSGDHLNGVQLSSWNAEKYLSDDVYYNVNFDLFMYIDGGVESEEGLYIDITNLANENWDFSGDFGMYVYFFYEVGGDTTASTFSAKAKQIPGNDKLYELEVPKLGNKKVTWGKVLITYNDHAALNGDDQYLTQDIYYNKTMHDDGKMCITFTGSAIGSKQEAQADVGYNDTIRANSWGERFVSTTAGIGVKCDDGVTPPSTDEWATMGTELSQASTKVKEIVKTATANSGGIGVEQGVARYDYIMWKYNTQAVTTYNDYAQRTDTANGGAYAYGAIRNNNPIFGLSISDDNTSVILIIIASSISILSITALSVLMIKKRKQQ